MTHFIDTLASINRWVPQMLFGFKITLQLFLITSIFSIPLGLILAFIRTINKPKSLVATIIYKIFQFMLEIYILIMRGTPLLLQLFFVYYGLPLLPIIGKYLIIPDRFTAGAIAFILNYAAYFAEIFRGGLLSVDKGQFEASKVLGLTSLQTKLKIVIPQMFRISLPSVANETIILLKDTALITSIGLVDLLKITTNIVNKEANINAFALAAVFYLIVSYLLTKLFKKLEKNVEF